MNQYLYWLESVQLIIWSWLDEKDIKNEETVTCKLGPALTSVTNHKLEVTREERRTKEEIVKRQKIEAMAIKWHKVRGAINSFDEEKDNSDIKDDIDRN